jgi:hypothetical protein
MEDQFDRTFVIFGEPASKANSRRLVTIKGRPALIKSQKAIDYVSTFQSQCAEQMRGADMVEGDLVVEIMIHYASRRPDLDESVILDAMQGIVYKNDRQVRQRMIYWGLDPELPRSVIRVRQCDIDVVPDYLKTSQLARG